ncbi:MAG: cyclic nucleotide-binding domain-containing protein [Rhodothermales bacterium]|nr:cyclic nucleotide-binding domain-containing protein [Rhodothermales bacterium]MBO6778487.1 cyclic nucleotide-binding domain-containing protein [Rhodothermales bacterium]
MAIGSTILDALRRLANRVFRREEDARVRAMAELLDEIPLFRPLPRGMLLDLAAAFHERSYRKDEFLYYEGDPGIGLYVVQSGNVRLLVEDPEGTTHEICEVGPNEILGATCLLGGGVIKRTESAQATVPTQVLGLFSPEFRTLQRRHPKTGAAVATLLARHFAQRLTETRKLLIEESGSIETATWLAQAARSAAEHADPPPGW